uniref:Uncharacterized protein n=1 Tax=Ascaris lumbricoides TaxID=6252 RepID=A0A0M3I1E3_ASCLU
MFIQRKNHPINNFLFIGRFLLLVNSPVIMIISHLYCVYKRRILYA